MTIQVYEGDGVKHEERPPRFTFVCDELVAGELDYNDRTEYELNFFNFRKHPDIMHNLNALIELFNRPGKSVITVDIRCGTDRHNFEGYLVSLRNRNTQDNLKIELAMELPI